MKRLPEILIILLVCCIGSFLLVLKAANAYGLSAAYQLIVSDMPQTGTVGTPAAGQTNNVFPPAIPGQPHPYLKQPDTLKNNKQPLTLPYTGRSIPLQKIR